VRVFPIGYEVFSENTYEGHTLEDALARIRDKYEIAVFHVHLL
jgi:hypothetical protein